MRWQIAQFVFCDQQQSLTSEVGTQQLEPMMVELLSYFCQHKDQIVSKDQLIDQVWLGRVVNDNTVSKLITKLRKAFSDDARQPRFIATFPKKGYKFIADVIQLDCSEVNAVSVSPGVGGEMKEQPPETITSVDLKTNHPSSFFSDNSKGLALWSLGALLIAIFMLLLFPENTQKQPVLSHVKAITSDAGDEFFPAFSLDGSRVAYMLSQPDRIHLKIKNLQNQSNEEISHGQGIGVGPASWSFDGKLLVYLVASAERCQYYIRKVKDEGFGEPVLIHNCPVGSYGKIAFTHDNNKLIYSESEGGDSPYTLFEINLTTGTKKKLNQPEQFLGGNSQFDVHPSEDKLLISSPDKQQWEGFYSLDLASDKLELLFKQDAYICCGIWSHDGERVVLMGEYPAHQLVSYDLKGQDAQVVYSGSREIMRPRRHTNGVDYAFSSRDSNDDIYLMDIASQKQQELVNDSVDEMRAIFAPQADKIAYISLASGNEEVWLLELATGKRKKLTQFNDSRHYIDLKWSPSADKLLGLTLNEIHIINSLNGEFHRLKIPQIEIRAVSFKTESVVSYSIQNNGKWQAYSYDLINNRVTAEDPRWQFVQFAEDKQDSLWLDQSNKLFVGESQKLAVLPVDAREKLLWGRQFNLKKRGSEWYWFERSKNAGIYFYNGITKDSGLLKRTHIGHFDVKNNQLLFGGSQEVNTNIYLTQGLK